MSQRDGAGGRYSEADQFLYVEARAWEGNERKLPVVPWVNGEKAPGGDVPNRTVENPYVETFEETTKGRPYIIVGAKDGFFLDIDIDIDDDGHEETFDGDHESVAAPDGVLSFVSASGGPHRILKTSDPTGGDLTPADGVDLQGDHPGNMGVVTSPFHHPEYDLGNVPEAYTDFEEVTGDPEGLNDLFGVGLFDESADEDDTGGDTVQRTFEGGGGPTFDLPDTNPTEKPTCYRNALRARRDGLAGANGHEVNLILANLGVNLGYTDRQIVEDCRDYTRGGGFDRDMTRQGVEGSRSKAKAGDLNPPNAGTLRSLGVLGEDGCSPECPIHGHQREYAAVLPEPPAAGNGRSWGSLEAAGRTGGLTKEDARERTTETVRRAFERGENALIEALPTLGKSYSAVESAAETGIPTTIVTSRGRKEQYEELSNLAEKFGLSVQVLPSVKEDCGMFTGDCGPDVQAKVEKWYHSGATGKEIHKNYENVTGEPLPCDGEAGDRCMYKAKWGFDAEDYDLLLGNYLHTHVSSVTNGRCVVIDEYPGSSFETELRTNLGRVVSNFLEGRPAIPFDSFGDLLENREDPNRRRQALESFAGLESDGDEAIYRDGHAEAGAAVYTLLAAVEGSQEDTDRYSGDRFTNGFERAAFLGEDGAAGVYDPNENRVIIRRKPDLRYARNVVALDGTPKLRLWEDVQHKKLNHRRVLSDEERAEYLTETMGYRFVRTTDYMKSYNSEKHVFEDEDATLLRAIRERHGEKAALLTTSAGETVHQRAGMYDLNDEGRLSRESGLVRSVGHYGNLKGSNRFKKTRLGAVIGANHYGDGFIQKTAAFLGADVHRGDGKGRDLEYHEANAEAGESRHGVGNMIHEHMTEDETLQAALRFGRDGNGATVYLHTTALPEVLEDEAAAEDGRVIQVHSKGTRQVLEALESMNLEGTGGEKAGGSTSAREVAGHEAVEVGVRQVRNILGDLEAEGHLRRRDPEGTNGLLWFDPGGELSEVGPEGHAALPNPARPDPGLTSGTGLGQGDRSEGSGSSNYRWDFRPSVSVVGEAGGSGVEESKGGDTTRERSQFGTVPPGQ